MITSTEMKELEQHAEQLGIPSELLMENAGNSAYDTIVEKFKEQLMDFKILILCGHGNNGGDGFVLARHLKDHEIKTIDIISIESARLSPAASAAHDSLLEMHPDSIQKYEDEDVIKLLDFEAYDLIIDAMLGIGIHGEPEEPYSHLIHQVNASIHPFVISIDIPSGIDPDTKTQKNKICINPDMIITFHDTKPALELPELKEKTVIADIGIPF